MRLSAQARYAICGVFDLAYNGQGRPVQVRVIGERQAIPERYLEQIFQRLRRGGIVTSKRGPRGGYTLARAPAEISLRDVVEAVEGPLGRPARTRAGRRAATPHQPAFLWPELEARLGEALARTSVEDVCRRAARGAIPRAEADDRMYFI